MSLLQQFRSRRFFLRILLTNTLLVVLFLLIFCSVVYLYSRSSTLELQQDANQKVLSQVNYNIDHLNEMVKSLAISAYNDRDLISLMNSQDIEVFQLYNKLYKLDQIVYSNLFVHSVAIYNPYNHCTYSNSSSTPVLCGSQNGSPLLKYLTDHPDPPKLTLLPYVEQENGRDLRGFAYIMYETIGNYSGKESVLMLIVKPEWLFDNIRAINELSDNSLGSVFLMDGEGQVIDRADQLQQSHSNREEIVALLRSTQQPSGYFISMNDAGKQIVTYRTSKVNDWKIVSIQPYDEVFGKINKIGTFSLIVLFVFILLSLIVSLLFSARLYKPVGRLMNQLKLMPARDFDIGEHDNKDELNYLSSVYANMQISMKQLRETSNASQHVLYQYFLRQLMIDSTSITEQQMEQYTNGRMRGTGSTFMLCLFIIDGYAAFLNDRSEFERKLCKFAIGNIAEEMMGEPFPTQIVDMMNDQLVLLIQLADTPDARSENKTSEDEIRIIADKVARSQEIIHKYYGLSLTAVFSESASDYRETTKLYEQAKLHANYRMIAGRMTIITPQQYDKQEKHPDEQIPVVLLKKLAEAIKNNQSEPMKQRLDEIIRCIATFHSENIDEAIMHLMMLVNHTVRDRNLTKAKTLTVNIKSYTRSILEQETLMDVHQLVLQMLQEIVDQRDDIKPAKSEFLIGAVKEMVQLNYKDANLSLQSIADVMKLSPGYLGRYFRSIESMSVADYINEVRLNQSLRLLEHSEDSIVEIMKKVGFSNESYFFKLFKKRMGITPNEYRLTRA